MHHLILAEVLRSRYHSHSSYGDVLLFQWLWRHLHWWGVLAFAGVTAAIGFLKNLFGADS